MDGYVTMRAACALKYVMKGVWAGKREKEGEGEGEGKGKKSEKVKQAEERV